MSSLRNGSAVADVLDCIESDEGCAIAVLVETNGLHASADRARLAAVLMDDDFRLVPGTVEVGVNEVDLRLDRTEVLLCPTL